MRPRLLAPTGAVQTIRLRLSDSFAGMNPRTPSDHTVRIPLEPALWSGAQSHAVIDLPLACRPRRGLMSAYAVLMAIFAALGLLLFGAAVSVLAAGSWLSAIAMLGLAVFSVVWFGGTGLALVADAIRAGPSIIIGPEDLHDRRQGISVRWTDVTRAEIRASRVGIASLALATRGSDQRSRKIGRAHV